MGPAFVILFWLIIGAILFGVTMFGLALFIAGKATRRRWLKWFGAVPLVGGGMLLCLLILFAGLCLVMLLVPMPSKWIFSWELGFKPPTDVVQLKAYSWSFADSGDCYLRFVATTNTLNRICSAYDFKPVSRDEFYQRLSASSATNDPPHWWKPLESSPTEFFTTTNLHKNFSHQEAILCFNPTNRIVHYYSIGID